MRRRKRHVRIHLTGDAPSIEGIFVGFWASHYVVRVPRVIESESRSFELDGDDVTVPKHQVLFMQRFS